MFDSVTQRNDNVPQVGGGEAVSSKVASTTAKVCMLHQSSTRVFARSTGTVVRTGSGEGTDTARNEAGRRFAGHRTRNPIFNRAVADPAPHRRQGSTGPSRHTRLETATTGALEPSTISTKTARILSALPLSKIKIVIGERLCTSVFA